MTAEALKKTPLNDVHRTLGGRMVDFGGWDMPVQYTAGVIEEHMATRTHSGLFDVSHMGEIWVEGPDAISFVNGLTTNDVLNLVDGQAHYSAMTNDEGGIVDDLLVYRFSQEKLLLVVNAGTTEKDWAWITSHKKDERVELLNASAEYCQIAVQGPDATAIVQKLTETDLSAIKYYHFTTGRVDGVDSIISRTGYTGEDGFEVYAAADAAIQLWNKILETGKYGTDGGIIPCGLAARNTLRLESAMSLYGHELGDDISPLEAGLGWITKFQKGPFTGSEILAKQKEVGVTRKIAGFEMTEPGIARDGCDIYLDGEKIGVVTSGSPAPFLKKNIGLAFLPPQFAIVGQEIKIDVRGRQIAAKVVSTPFYKRSN
ncbi:MAG TPA: glycine cleavage system aminomethyltransferase GcvT [Pyrinomonadaceae bacterium]|nr:glycine cleavage system aminomethyltransferase GcvT [Chloracidobacterium sp.]MBP9935311.1 glycine cleavage system aminomethyltransferase GcvT [Pyrinomonadaceae bacterium]MBK7804540.1 glycine cleavage system aminomethyltransferase GcvT [Chloracidobacterium sp.]MBK9768850.1 glycine cleavage system aminomethyltransferase GcvT [Chloracidobacterium sp.]MBL0240464.1 glycine cleavage system aminomethyltransferase GcvT [Chloracidobacterium sp.]